MKSFYVFFLGLFLSLTLFSQQEFPQDYFDPPVQIPIAPSGTFGELRSNHFHSGLDIRINGQVGEPVYAPADGYVSRIRISRSGGGKMLYIDHPNGFRSVYFHLDIYEGEIGDYVSESQYKNKKYEIEVFPQKNQLPVKKGQFVARAGNTGSSGGPHLHYEIRLSHNDQTINPLLFGLQIKDNIKPTIKEIRIYASDTNAQSGSHFMVSNLKKKVTKTIKEEDGTRRKVSVTQNVDTIKAWGKLYFGIDTEDKSLNSTSRLGVPSIKLYIDDSLFFSYDMKTFRFDQTRYINSMIDYPTYTKDWRRFLLTRISPGNKIHLIEAVNRGYFDCTDGKLHKCSYVVSDFNGNTTRRTFYIQSEENSQPKIPQNNLSEDYQWLRFNYSEDNNISTESFLFHANENIFFEDLDFRYRIIPDTNSKYFSDLFDLSQPYSLPVFKSFTVKLKPKIQMSEYLKGKAVIARVDNGKLSCEGGKWDGDYLATNSTTLGTFVITLDTIAPKITPVNFTNRKKVVPMKLRVKITDNFSGIKSYNCYLNEEWILAEYDAKTNQLILDSEKKIKKGNNQLKVVVSDNSNNQATKEYTVVN